MLTAFLRIPFTSLRCNNIGGSFCRNSPTNFRFYDVDVTATDSAGHSGTETCRVVVVPSCDPTVSPDICQSHNISDVDAKEGFYLARSYIDSAIADDQILYQVAELELEWNSSGAFPIVYPPPAPCSVDNDAPVVSCTIGAQPLCGNGAGGYVDLKLSATVVDGGEICTPNDDLEVVVQILSNEVSSGGDGVSVQQEIFGKHHTLTL